MRRQVASAGLFVAGAATIWAPSASASGHSLGALDFAFGVLLAFVAFVPWTISWWLLVGGKNSIRVFVWGTLTSAVATVLVVCGESSRRSLSMSARPCSRRPPTSSDGSAPR